MKEMRKPTPFALMVLAAGALSLPVSPALATPPQGGPGNRETRDYAVYVDNRPAGQFQMTIANGADGQATMTGQADVRVKYFLKSYTYSYRGTETWASNRPARVEAATNDDGKATRVTAVARQDGSVVVTTNGEQRAVPGFQWTTTYWRLPPDNVLQKQLNILDVDSGKIWQGKLQPITPVLLNLGWRKIHCTYYKLDTEIPAELWFDEQGRMVRQITVEDGHRTELRLSGMR